MQIFPAGSFDLCSTKYLPRQGDMFVFLESAGALNLAEDIRYEYSGAIPGFNLDVSVDGSGNVTFTAENDALGEQVFANEFE